jgi:hypothetical protein
MQEGTGTVRDTEFPASFFCHFKKLRCKSLFIVNVFTCVEGPKLIVVYWVTNNLLNNIKQESVCIETCLVSRVKSILSRSWVVLSSRVDVPTPSTEGVLQKWLDEVPTQRDIQKSNFEIYFLSTLAACQSLRLIM